MAGFVVVPVPAWLVVAVGLGVTVVPDGLVALVVGSAVVRDRLRVFVRGGFVVLEWLGAPAIDGVEPPGVATLDVCSDVEPFATAPGWLTAPPTELVGTSRPTWSSP